MPACILWIFIRCIIVTLAMTGRTLINLLKFQLCILVIMLIFAKVNGIPLSSNFYFYALSILAFWLLLTLYADNEDADHNHTMQMPVSNSKKYAPRSVKVERGKDKNNKKQKTN